MSPVTTACNGATVHPKYLDAYRAVAKEQGNVEILSSNLSTLNPTRNALKFNSLLLYEKAETNGTRYLVQQGHRDSSSRNAAQSFENYDMIRVYSTKICLQYETNFVQRGLKIWKINPCCASHFTKIMSVLARKSAVLWYVTRCRPAGSYQRL